MVTKTEAIQEAINCLGKDRSNERIRQYVRNRYGTMADTITDGEVMAIRMEGSPKTRTSPKVHTNIAEVSAGETEDSKSHPPSHHGIFTGPKSNGTKMESSGIEDGMRVARKLSQDQFYRFCEWMKAHKERLQADRPTHRETARMAKADLGFEISHHSVARVQKTTKVSWQSDDARLLMEHLESRGVQEQSKEYLELAERIASLTEEVRQLVTDREVEPFDELKKSMESLSKTMAHFSSSAVRMNHRLDVLETRILAQKKLIEKIYADMGMEVPKEELPLQ